MPLTACEGFLRYLLLAHDSICAVGSLAIALPILCEPEVSMLIAHELSLHLGAVLQLYRAPYTALGGYSRYHHRYKQ